MLPDGLCDMNRIEHLNDGCMFTISVRWPSLLQEHIKGDYHEDRETGLDLLTSHGFLNLLLSCLYRILLNGMSGRSHTGYKCCRLNDINS